VGLRVEAVGHGHPRDPFDDRDRAQATRSRTLLRAPTRTSFAPVFVCVCVCVSVCLFAAGLAVGVDRVQRCGPVPHSAHAVTRPCARACVARESARGCAGERVRMGARAPRLHDCVRARVRAQRRAATSLTAARRCSASARQRSRRVTVSARATPPRHSLRGIRPGACCMLHPCLACCILSLHVASFPCMLHPFLACCILSLHVASFPCMLHPVSGRMCYACCCRGGLCLRRAWRLATRAVLRTARHSFWRPSHGAFCMGFCGMSHGRAVTRS
jgi:hypothetical protein